MALQITTATTLSAEAAQISGLRDAALHRNMLRVFLSREMANTYAAQFTCALIVFIGIVSGIPSAIAIGIVRIVNDQIVRRTLRQLSKALISGEDLSATERRVELVFYSVGFTWALVSWPAYTATTFNIGHLVMAVIAPVSLVIMVGTTCFAPKVFRATQIGFGLGMLLISLYVRNVSSVLLIGATIMLLLLSIHHASGTARQMARMFRMQAERDEAILRQKKTILELDDARNAAATLASIDSLTGLPNREAFMSRLAALIEKPKAPPFTLMLLDVDLFKNINDSMGHHVGDAVLKGVAQALTSMNRASCFPARLGGDEFALLLVEACSPDCATRVFDSIAFAIGDLSGENPESPVITVTGGSACFPQHGADRTALLTAADMAQREAKRMRRGTHQMYRSGLSDVFQRETTIANLLNTSIESGLVEIYFQPKIDLKDGTIVGAEALSRFKLPALSEYAVQEVFDVAERRGLGAALADVTLVKAGHAILALQRDLNQPLSVAVNLSQSSLKTPDRLLARIRGYIEQGLSPKLVRLEITEHAISGRGLDNVAKTLADIVGLGYSLSLDDFGTGEASMANLRGLPIAEIKIDRRFIQNICADTRDQAIVKGTLVMCDYLGVECVAEGIETAPQAEKLRDMGAHTGQGYLWAKPMPADRFVAFANGFTPRGTMEKPKVRPRIVGAAT